MNAKFVILILIAGLMTACASQPVETPASQPTEEPVPATQAPTNPPLPTETTVPTLEPTMAPAASSGVSFANEILPLIESRCKNCHGGNKTEEGLNLLSHASILKGSDNGPVVIPGDAEGSLLVKLLLKQEMPKRGPKLTPPQVQLIVDWVNQGALDN